MTSYEQEEIIREKMAGLYRCRKLIEEYYFDVEDIITWPVVKALTLQRFKFLKNYLIRITFFVDSKIPLNDKLSYFRKYHDYFSCMYCNNLSGPGCNDGGCPIKLNGGKWCLNPDTPYVVYLEAMDSCRYEAEQSDVLAIVNSIDDVIEWVKKVG